MPAIRDYAYNYNSSTSALHLSCAQPDVVENDLLIAPCSADTGTQTWAGMEPLDQAWYMTGSGSTYTDETTAANNTTAGDVHTVNTTPAVNDAFYWGSNTPFNAASLLVSTAGAGTWTWVVEYYNGAWVTLTTLANGITVTAAAGLRMIVFNPPTDWTTVAVNGSAARYWVRLRVSAYTSITTRPLYTQAFVGKWNQLYSATNTVNQGIMYKVAGAAEPAEYTFGYTTAETSNVSVIAVKDVDTALPLAQATMSSYSSATADQAMYSGSVIGVSQSFTATAYRLASVKFWLKKVGSPTGNITAKLYTHSGTLGSSSIPTGVALAVSNVKAAADLTTSYALIEFTFPWYFQYLLTAANYVVSVEYSGGDASNYVHVGHVTTSGHAGNKATNTGGTWTAQGTHDCYFAVTNFTYATGTATAAKSNLPTMTTSRDNSLVLFMAVNAGTSTTTLYNTSILEGACTSILAKDGTGHSDAVAWGFQATAGTTATVGQSNLGTGTQTISTGVIAVNPPSTGATVIPTYCAADSSEYVSPFTGAAYNGDSVPANTITTPFTGTIAGKTLSAGGTTVTRADTGVNSYHAMTNCTGLTTPNTWAGIRNTIVARTTLANKNILFHAQPYLPLDIQTTDSVALTGACGVAIGLASTAGNFKVWHVGGAFSSWGIQRHQPIIINTGATAGLLQTTGTLNTASIAEVGMMLSGKVVAPNWLFGSVWALDTTTVCGGNATYPITIPGIVLAAADGKERRSCIQQGSSQMLVMQPVQIGNGGTNPTYLNLDATAIEFPRQYDKDRKEVWYNSTDNVCGLKYYAGASDTIIHKNSVISSASRYHWGLHSSFSTSCTPDFSGLSVIGAGTITLARAVTITELTINNYSTIDASGLTLTYSNILNVPNTNDSLTLSASSNIDYCNINTTGLTTAGNRLCSVADPTIFSHCAFTGSGSTGHAIRITTAGTYSFVGNTFASYGADASNSAAIFNDSGGAVTLNISGGGSTPTVRNGTSASTTVNNNVTLTITANVTLSGAEIRIYDLDNTPAGSLGTELSGTESHGSATYSYSGSASNSIWIQVMKSGYEEFGQATTMPSADGNLDIILKADINA